MTSTTILNLPAFLNMKLYHLVTSKRQKSFLNLIVYLKILIDILCSVVRQSEFLSIISFFLYRISITLFTNGGLSPPAWVDILTDQDTPGPVSNLTVVDRTHDAISIQWAPPNVKNGIITGNPGTSCQPLTVVLVSILPLFNLGF